ncbi:SPASM domain-containing protein [bacterium]|nr:SPASM domain-containing protein [bacterium]
MKYCSKPFEEFEIDVDGKCYCCCRWWNNSYCLGNILEQSVDEIWNGEAAQELRRSILEGDYKYCNVNECLPNHSTEVKYEKITNYPLEISFCYDYSCTAKCVFCNDTIKMMSKEECTQWDNIIESKLIPLLINAKFVRLTMVGELFVSNHSIKLVQRISEKYPNIKFEIVSNGIFASEENIKKLNIEGKIASIKFSIPSFRPSTYKKLVRNGNLEAVKKNLKYISKLHKNKAIEDFRLNFIISSVNYKEIIEYVKYAEELGAQVDCLLLDKKDESTTFLKNFDKYNVASPNHFQYNNFIDILNSEELKKHKNIHINPCICEMKKVSFIQRMKIFIKAIFLGRF